MLKTLKSKYTKVAAIAVAGVLLSSGISAVFTDSVSTQTQNLNTGTGSLEITGGSLEAKATSSVEDLVPGDSVTRDLFLTNAASYDLATISLEVTDSETGAPLTSHAEGLKMTIERETAPGTWAQIYTGNTTGAPVMADIDGPAKTSLGVDHLRFTQTFIGPNADKSLKDKVAQLTYIFTGTQRDGNAGPQAPTGLAATSGNSGSPFVTLSWEPSSGADTYQVERSTNGGASFSALGTTTGGGSGVSSFSSGGESFSFSLAAAEDKTFVDASPPVETTVIYRVKAANESGISDPSETAEVTPFNRTLIHLPNTASVVGSSNFTSYGFVKDASERVYIVGGNVNGSSIDTRNFNLRFNPASNSWDQLAGMPGARGNAGVVSVGDSIFSIGGANSSAGWTRDVYKYDVASNTWSELTQAPVGMTNVTARVVGTDIYIVFAQYTAGSSAATYKYDTINDTWTQLANRPNTSFPTAATIWNGKIALVAGWGDLQVFDVATNSWSTLPVGSDFTGGQRDLAAAPDGSLYLTDGKRVEKFNGSVWSLVSVDTAVNEPSNSSPPRMGFDNSNNLYMMGSRAQGGFSPFRRLDMNTNTWSTINTVTGGTENTKVIQMSSGRFYVAGNMSTVFGSGQVRSF